MNSEWKLVGKVKDAHGLKGELSVLVFSQDVSWQSKLKTIRLISNEQSDAIIDLEIERSKPYKAGLIIKGKQICDRTDAEKVVGWQFFIPVDLLVSKPGERIYLSEILYFVIEKIGKGVVGKIVGFSSNGVQDLLIVKTQSGDFEVPFVENFIDDIDFVNKRIFMSLPDGLLEEIQDMDEEKVYTEE